MLHAQFPIEYSLGELALYKNWLGDPRLMPARGEVCLNEDDRVILSVNQETCNNLDRLQRLPPNAINGVAFMMLDLSGCDFTALSIVPRMEFLGVIRGNILPSHKQALSSLREIQVLDLTGTKPLAPLDWLHDMRGLERLLLSFTDVGDQGLLSLPNLQLRDLSLLGTQVSDRSVPRLAAIRSLTDLTLTLTRVTEQGRKRLAERLPKCTIRFDSSATHGVP